jgi:hypothetical protein
MLHGRFDYAKVIETYNLFDNMSWFGVKALIDYRKNEPSSAVSDQSYAKTINSRHFLHIGCAVGPIIAEMAEANGDEMVNLGNWNLTVKEE